MKVFISSEEELPIKLKKYKIKIAPNKFHDALAFSSLYIGEGGTTASEAAMLGVPTIYINTLVMGYLKELQHEEVVSYFSSFQGVTEKVEEIIKTSNARDLHKVKRDKFLISKIDPTAFMVWFIENYPKSVEILKKNPDYQYRFR